MSTQDLSIIQSIEDYSSSIIQVLNDILALLNTGKITIYFDSHGGSTVPPYIAYKGQSIGVLPVPKKDGYEFKGWYLTYHYNPFTEKETYSNEISNYSEVNLTSGIVLHAKWDYAYYTIYFDPVGGSVNPTYKKVQYNHEYGELPVAISPTGIFSYWEDEYEEMITSSSILSTWGDKILTAVYGDIDFKLSFNYDYFKELSVAGELELENPTMVPSSERFGLGNYTQDARSHLSAKGYNFVGWSEAMYSPDIVPMVKLWEDTTIYAYWKPNTYILRYCNELGYVLSTQILTYGQPEYLISPNEILDSYASDKLTAWNYSANNVDNIVLQNATYKSFNPEQMVCNLLSSNHGVCSISASFSNGHSYETGNFTANYVQQTDKKYIYYKGDLICCSAFRINLYKNGKFFMRVPTKVSPKSLTESGYVKFYYGNNNSTFLEYWIDVKEKETPVSIKLLLGEGDKKVKTDYAMGDYPDLTYLSVEEITNYGNTYIYDDNYTYSPTSALYQDGAFSISCLSKSDETTISVFSLPYNVEPVIDKLSIYYSEDNPLKQTFIDGDYFNSRSLNNLYLYKHLLSSMNPNDWIPVPHNDLFEENSIYKFSVGGTVIDDISTGLSLSEGDYQVRIFVDQQKKRVGVSYPITVKEDIGELKITRLPSKIRYAIGEEFDPEGMSGMIVYKNHGSYVVEGNELVTNTQMFTTVGVRPVNVYYGDVFDTISVGVRYPNLIGIFDLQRVGGKTIHFDCLKTDQDNGFFSVDYGFRRDIPTPDNYGNSLSFGFTSDNYGLDSYYYPPGQSITSVSVYTQYDTNKNLYIDVSERQSNSFMKYVYRIYGHVPDYFLSNVNVTATDGHATYLYLEHNNELSCEKIGESAFESYNGILSIFYDDNLKQISQNAFYDSEVKTFSKYTSQSGIHFDKNLEEIAYSAFSKSSDNNTVGFTKVYVHTPSNLRNIGSYAFANRKNVSFEGDGNLQLDGIYSNAFMDCTNAKIDLNKYVGQARQIGDSAFENTTGEKSNGQLHLSRCELIGQKAFRKSNNFLDTSVYFDSPTNNIGMSCFMESNVKSIILTDNIIASYIPDYFAYGCTSLSNISIPDKIQSIGMYSFMNDMNLSTVEIPASVQSIGLSAFANCATNLKLKFAESLDVLSNEYDIQFDQIMEYTNLTTALQHCEFEAQLP